ncbi:EpsG family protein [Escherichia albertii]|uniref:EpsG family protein n=1 Tax=Escherichia albertii TaxID=208962 RepID=UPI0010F8497F|nr:EpsG family protein [Escherichia albertii]MCU7272566.1 EpsG family protein [Escherichia albertii]
MYKIKKSTLILILGAIVLILMAGFKPIGIDRDSINYVKMLQSPFNYSDLVSREPAFNLIQIIYNIFFSGTVAAFFFIFALLGVGLKILAIKKSSDYPIFSFLLYVFFYYILHDLTQIRAGVASALFLLSIYDRVNSNNRQALVKIILAVCFHYSAIITLFIFLLKNRINRVIYVLLPIMGMLSSLLLSNNTLEAVNQHLPYFIANKINTYLALQDNSDINRINIFNIYYSTLVFIYLSIIVFVGDRLTDRDVIYVKIFGVGLFCFYSMSFIPVLAFRISEFLCVVIIILFANISNYIKEKYIYQLGMFILGIGYFITQSIMQNINL